MRSSHMRLLPAVLFTAFFVGCANPNRQDDTGGSGGILRAGLPPSATVVTEGSGQLTYTPEEHGQVYLYDVNQDRVVGRYQLRRAQRLALDGVSGRATIDGNEVRVAPTRPKGTYQVYFMRDPLE